VLDHQETHVFLVGAIVVDQKVRRLLARVEMLVPGEK